MEEQKVDIKPRNNKKAFMLFGAIIAYLLIVTPLVVVNLQKQQNIRGKAQVVTPSPTSIPPLTCGGTEPNDIMLVIDRSTSMAGQKITDAKAAAVNFVDIIDSADNNSRIGLITFGPDSTINLNLTSNYASVKSAINAVALLDGTCAQCAVNKVNQVFGANSGTNNEVVVFLTDGRANRLESGPASNTTAEQGTLTSINNGPDVPYYTIGLGSNVNSTFLQNIATTTGGTYYFTPTSTDLKAIYTKVAKQIECPPTPTPQPTTILTPTTKPTSTPVPTLVPTTTLPTVTTSPDKITLSLDILLDGIGNRGDNTNPTAFSLSNKNPLNPTKKATVQIFNEANNLVASETGDVKYTSASGSFKGLITLKNSIPSGNYTVRVKVERYLQRLVPGIQNLLTGEINIIPTVGLVTGDVNNDNKLNILDYNMILTCYSDLQASKCESAKLSQTDINDDGLVNQIDYNLFLREIITQPGE